MLRDSKNTMIFSYRILKDVHFLLVGHYFKYLYNLSIVRLNRSFFSKNTFLVSTNTLNSLHSSLKCVNFIVYK